MADGYRVFALLLALALPACEDTIKLAEGEYYRIPAENDLQNTFAASYVRSVYGASETPRELGIVFKGDEVATAIPGFKPQVQGYIGQVDESPSATIRKSDAATNANFDAALRDNVARLESVKPLEPYTDGAFAKVVGENIMFDLRDPGAGWHRTDMIPPACVRSAAQDPSIHYDSCLFRVRRGGYDVSFWLHGENAIYADAFAEFMLARLYDWRVRPEN